MREHIGIYLNEALKFLLHPKKSIEIDEIKAIIGHFHKKRNKEVVFTGIWLIDRMLIES